MEGSKEACNNMLAINVAVDNVVHVRFFISGDSSVGSMTLYSTNRSPCSEGCSKIGIPSPLIVCTYPVGGVSEMYEKRE